MRVDIHEGSHVAGEEIVVEEEIVGEVFIGAVPGLAGEVISEDDRDLDGRVGTPRMASWV